MENSPIFNEAVNNLVQAIENRRIKEAKRRKANYDLARSLGFTGIEASMLSQRSRKNLLAFAKLRDKNISTNTTDVTNE